VIGDKTGVEDNVKKEVEEELKAAV